jgi:hypothetical protein
MDPRIYFKSLLNYRFTCLYKHLCLHTLIYLSLHLFVDLSIYLSPVSNSVLTKTEGSLYRQAGRLPFMVAAHVLLCLHCHPPMGVYRGAGQVSSANRTRRSATTLCPFLCVTLFISRFFCWAEVSLSHVFYCYEKKNNFDY